MIDPVIDPAAIASLRELQEHGTPEILSELVRMFLEFTPKRLGDLNSALMLQDLPAISAIGHTLRSTCGNLGVRNMMDLATEIETLARSGSTRDLPRLVAKLNDEYLKAKAAIERL